MTRQSHVAIVGGGIVGLATAYTLSERGWRVTVLDKESRPAFHQSGRNSGVIHSGVYYRPESLKARTCKAGRPILERYCDERAIPWRRCGKVIVATNSAERTRLQDLEARGRANGVACERIGQRALLRREPAVRGSEALWVPEAGVVDYGRVCSALAADVVAGGGTLIMSAEVRRLESRRDSVVVHAVDPRHSVSADAAINCGGLWSDRLAAASIGSTPSVHILPFRGEYYALSPEAANRVGGLIYPVGDPRFPFLGVHLTRHVDHRVTAGPNAVLAMARDGYRWRAIRPRDLVEIIRSPGLHRLVRQHASTGLREIWRSAHRRAFLTSARRLMPSLELRDLSPYRAGVRAQAVDAAGELLDDFRFFNQRRVVHVLNAPSPAATACFAIGHAIADELRSTLPGG